MHRHDSTPQGQAVPDFAPIEARLMAILSGANAQADSALSNIVAIMDRCDMPPVLRVKLLLFTATAAAACIAGRVTVGRTGELYHAEIQNAMRQHADGRMIMRHRMLLLRLIRRGCEMRGEIPAINGKDTTDANA